MKKNSGDNVDSTEPEEPQEAPITPEDELLSELAGDDADDATAIAVVSEPDAEVTTLGLLKGRWQALSRVGQYVTGGVALVLLGAMVFGVVTVATVSRSAESNAGATESAIEDQTMEPALQTATSFAPSASPSGYVQQPLNCARSDDWSSATGAHDFSTIAPSMRPDDIGSSTPGDLQPINPDPAPSAGGAPPSKRLLSGEYTWSPTRDEALFSGDSNGLEVLALMDANAVTHTRLAPDLDLRHGYVATQWSPNGNYIVIASESFDGEQSLHVVTRSGKLTHVYTGCAVLGYSWNGDSSILYFGMSHLTAGLEGSDAEAWVFAYTVADAVVTPMFPGAYPSISSDHSKMVLIRDITVTSRADRSLWIFEPGDAEPRLLAEAGGLHTRGDFTLEDRAALVPTWRPDSGQFALIQPGRNGPFIGLFLNDQSNYDQSQYLLDAPRYERPRWAADGSVVYGSTYIYDVAAGDERQAHYTYDQIPSIGATADGRFVVSVTRGDRWRAPGNFFLSEWDNIKSRNYEASVDYRTNEFGNLTRVPQFSYNGKFFISTSEGWWAPVNLYYLGGTPGGPVSNRTGVWKNTLIRPVVLSKPAQALPDTVIRWFGSPGVQPSTAPPQGWDDGWGNSIQWEGADDNYYDTGYYDTGYYDSGYYDDYYEGTYSYDSGYDDTGYYDSVYYDDYYESTIQYGDGNKGLWCYAPHYYSQSNYYQTYEDYPGNLDDC